MDFSTPRCVLWTSLFWKRPRNAMRTGPKTDFQWYLRGILRPIIFKTIFFWEELLLWSIFQFCGQQLEQVLVDIVLSPYIVIWHGWTTVGWAGHDACLHTMKPLHHVHSLSVFCVPATLPCPRFFFPRILRVKSERLCLTCSTHEERISTHVPRKAHIYINTYVTSCTWTRRKHINSCTTKSAHLYQHVCHFMHMNQKETYQPMYHEKRTSISTRMSLHVHEPEGNISTHVPRKVHIYINTYVTSCTWTRRKHINSCTTKSANLYQHVCHFMYMNQKETYQLMYHEKCTSMYINTYVTSCTWTRRKTYQLMYGEKRTSISTRMSLHVHEPEGNISTHVPRKVHSVSTRMSLSCTWTRRKHINSCTRKVHSVSTRMSLHVHEPEGNISTHVPRKVHSVSTRMSLHVHEPEGNISTHVHVKCTAYQHVCHFMYMNQKETYKFMHHEKCTAYQHVCHFMYMNQKETYQLMYT